MDIRLRRDWDCLNMNTGGECELTDKTPLQLNKTDYI